MPKALPKVQGANQDAPNALQVADRWHLLQNLRQALERVLERHPAALQAVAVLVPPRDEGPRQVRRSRRQTLYAQVLARQARGLSQRAVARHLGISRITVGRYLSAGIFPEIARRPQLLSMLQAYRPYLAQQWAAGRQNARQLWREVQAQGYLGSYKLVAVWAHQRRRAQVVAATSDAPVPSVRRPRSAHEVVWLLLRQPTVLSPEEQARLALICASSPAVQVAYELGQAFLAMVRERQPDALLPQTHSCPRRTPAVVGSGAGKWLSRLARLCLRLTPRFGGRNSRLDGSVEQWPDGRPGQSA